MAQDPSSDVGYTTSRMFPSSWNLNIPYIFHKYSPTSSQLNTDHHAPFPTEVFQSSPIPPKYSPRLFLG